LLQQQASNPFLVTYHSAKRFAIKVLFQTMLNTA
jgi:hypothetical protein